MSIVAFRASEIMLSNEEMPEFSDISKVRKDGDENSGIPRSLPVFAISLLINFFAGVGGPEKMEENSPPRLLVVSSRAKNIPAMTRALRPNVDMVQYKYENSSLDGILGAQHRIEPQITNVWICFPRVFRFSGPGFGT